MEEKISFKYYFSILLEHRKLIFLTTLFIFVPFYLLSINVSYYFESYALAEILRVPYTIPYESDSPLYGGRAPGIDIPKTITKLRTVEMAEAVLARLSLDTYRDFEDELTLKEKIVMSAKKLLGEERINALKKFFGRPLEAKIDSLFYKKMILDNFRSRLEINYSGSELIKIKMSSENAYAAYECVKQFIDEWHKQNLDEKKLEILTAKTFLEKIHNTAKAELLKKENQLNNYKNRLGIGFDDVPILGQNEMKQLSQYEKEMAGSQSQLDRIDSKLLDLDIKIANIQGNLKIIEPPRIDLMASGASRLKLKIMGLILGMGFGAGLALIKGLLDNSIRSEEEIKRITNIPILGIIPKFDFKRNKI